MRGLRIAALALAFAALVLTPAGVAGMPTTGTQITLGDCVASSCASTYPAGEPFFVRHGFVGETRAALVNPDTKFVLTVDGENVAAAIDLDLTSEEPSKLYVTNFRHGMTGVHTFTGCWYAEGVLAQCGTRTVTFTG